MDKPLEEIEQTKPTKEKNNEIHLIIKRFVKVLIAIVLIKAFRLIMTKNEQVNSTIQEIFSITPTEDVFRFFSLNLLILGIIGLVIASLIKGKELLNSKIFNFLFFFCLIDAMFIYVFPEIPASVFKAIFLKQ